MKLEIYDPHMCCPTGLCGPSPDERMLHLSEILKELKRQYPKLMIARYMISQQPMRFKQNTSVFSLLQKHGKDVLPIVTFNGGVICKGRYPELNEITAHITKKQGVIL